MTYLYMMLGLVIGLFVYFLIKQLSELLKIIKELRILIDEKKEIQNEINRLQVKIKKWEEK